MAHEKRIGQLAHVRVSDTLAVAVKLIAEREDRSEAWVIRSAVEAFVSKYMVGMVDHDDEFVEEPCGEHCASPERGTT